MNGARDLAHLSAVGAHHVDLEPARPDQALLQERRVLLALGGRLRVGRAVHDEPTVPREERPAVVARTIGEARHPRAVGVHHVQVEVAIAERGEDDTPAIG
jgi:hypothetical protein